jgi:membrane-bound metal-dependent hydrolase YbcI (DUF457 family)
MPFTPAHSAAALPFRRSRFVLSALVIGTMAPDFEYFLRLAPDAGFGHTLLGTFVLTLPVALLVLWVFHTFVKTPAIMLLPDGIQRRLSGHVQKFRFGGAARFSLIVFSVLLGIATHLFWDSFTHPATWIVQHWSVLRQSLQLAIIGQIPVYKILQHGSTIVGIGLLSIWFMHWYRTTGCFTPPIGESLSPTRRGAIIAVVVTVALAGAVLRGVMGAGASSGGLASKKFIGEVIVTAIALAWWQLVAYGWFSSRMPSGNTV